MTRDDAVQAHGFAVLAASLNRTTAPKALAAEWDRLTPDAKALYRKAVREAARKSGLRTRLACWATLYLLDHHPPWPKP